ncbi:MAG: UDP-galactopyranose mutase [Clostridiales bacterium]|jgi:UDP-galactopyranose mutase|nr:UDP-galactopyranose mutase [Clostridiales bacterium]
MHPFDAIVVGAGLSGAVSARRLAESGKRILLLESRGHIAGNAYDYINEWSILVHRYGPHIFHTNDEEAFNYLSQFTTWLPYTHRVIADLGGKEVQLPFNFNSLKTCFGPQSNILEEKLKASFPGREKVPINELLESQDTKLKELGQFIFENFFVHYSKKQWGRHFENLDRSVFARVPINISFDDRYFSDKYQGMPSGGYTKLVEQMLAHPNIELKLSTNSDGLISLSDGATLFNGQPFAGALIYTGQIDCLFKYTFGRLPYRTLRFEFENHPATWYQSYGVVNYTTDKPFTRITEYKHLTGQTVTGKTTIAKEYPLEFTGAGGEDPYYPIQSLNASGLYQRYINLAKKHKNLYLLGRLAEYKYYNMDAVVSKALKLTNKILSRGVEAIE